jgi:GH43 family beta-xylosidase
MKSDTTVQYHNPVVLQRADPWIYRHTDGYYYFTASVPAYDSIELRRAERIDDLSTADTVTVWERHAAGEMSFLIWAPEIHYLDGKWVIYFSASHTHRVFDHRIYILECDDKNPFEGKWEEKGKVDTGWDSFALDATSFIYDGRQYLVWAQRDPAIEGNSNLYIAKMKDPYTLDSEAVMLTYPEYEWERRKYLVNEGPAAIIRNGKVFITYSASATDKNYCMGLLWAEEGADLLDASNWHKSEQPVFATNEKNGQYGPGHNSFTIAEDGVTDLLVYHARNYDAITGDELADPNRHTRVQAFTWDSEGMPVFGEPVPDSDDADTQ